MKIAAADSALLEHEGRAIVFEDDPRSRRPRRRPGPRVRRVERDGAAQRRPGRAPGMPEWGHLPILAKLLRQGVTDLLRISDARMSGTSYGAVVLHVAPESAVGAARARPRRRPDPARHVRAPTRPLVDEAELERRRASWKPPSRRTSVDTGCCTRTTSCRPTRAATSTSSAARRLSSRTPSPTSDACGLSSPAPGARSDGRSCRGCRRRATTCAPPISACPRGTAPARRARGLLAGRPHRRGRRACARARL